MKSYEESNYCKSYRNLADILYELPSDMKLSDGGDSWSVFGLLDALAEGCRKAWREAKEDLLCAEEYALRRWTIARRTDGGWENVYRFDRPAW